MGSFNLNIADYKIRFESQPDAPEFVPAMRFQRYFYSGSDIDFLIKVHSGKYMVPAEALKVFNAPYVEEINGIRIKKRDKFWSIHKHNDDLFIKSVFPLSAEKKEAVLKFSLKETKWDLWIHGGGSETDPFEYPLDGLILYYLTAITGDIMIHASGVSFEGRGYMFSGASGKGKSTMAKLLEKSGAEVIHDDRLIIRKTANGYKMFNTPVYNNDRPNESKVDRIFLIEHGAKNELIPVKGAAAISLVMANCIQHNWDQEIVARLINSASSLCNSIPVYRLPFVPGKSIIDHILADE